MKKTVYACFLLIGLAGIGFQLFLLKARDQQGGEPSISVLQDGQPVAHTAIPAANPVPPVAKVPQFALTERSGHRVNLNSLKGKVWLADFIFTRCPDICPLMNSRIAGIQDDLLGLGENVSIVSFSVDPMNDTPQVLRDYADHLGAKERWLFLTGDKEQIRRIAMEGFRLAFQNESGEVTEINHSSKIALVDQEGNIVRYYEGIGKDESAQMVADVRRLLKGEGVKP